MPQYPDYPQSSTPFSTGDVLDFNPEKRSTHLGSPDEGLARQAVYSSFIDREAVGHVEAIVHDLMVRGTNIEAMRKEILGVAEQPVSPIEASPAPATPIARKPDEYYLPGYSVPTNERAA